MNSDDTQISKISILVPILNELAELPDLLADLSRQQQVAFELLICDGGSTDGSCEWLAEQGSAPFSIKLFHAPPGRARQLNLAAREARGQWLLILHADSRFSDPLALFRGVAVLQRAPRYNLAGHFALRFRQVFDEASLGYYYYEWKARLGRPESIHGDQGFLLPRRLWRQVGPFREDLPVMEDTDFAERLRQVGQWRLLPAEISTSARRFEQEGLWQRQLLNALIMCFRDIDWQEFFTAAPQVYRQQKKAGKLELLPFFDLIWQLLQEKPCRERWRIWWASGCYVRKHAWQLLFALDARRAFRKGLPVGQGRTPLTDFFEPLYELLSDHRAGRMLATGTLYLWFLLMRLRLQKKSLVE